MSPLKEQFMIVLHPQHNRRAKKLCQGGSKARGVGIDTCDEGFHLACSGSRHGAFLGRFD
jgi:hypothetical protein